jgi:hypothetical protein
MPKIKVKPKSKRPMMVKVKPTTKARPARRRKAYSVSDN